MTDNTLLPSKNWLRLALVSAVIAPNLTWASGYKINEQSASGVGNAYAGRAAVVEDASVVYYNPAGMAFLEQGEISTGISYINADARMTKGSSTNKMGYQTNSSDSDTFNDGGDFVPDHYIPFFYAASPVNDKIAVGIGFYVPFGASADYGDGFVGSNFADKTSIRGIELQPTIAYKVNDQLAFGFGLDILHMEGELTKSVDTRPYAGNNRPGNVADYDDSRFKGFEGASSVEGEDWGYGFNLSMMWKATEATTLGVVYRSAIDLDLRGESKLYVPDGKLSTGADNAAGAPFKLSGTTLTEKSRAKVTTPQNITVSLAHRIDQWTFQTGVTWTEWSKFKNFDVKSTEGAGSISQVSAAAYNLDAGYIIHIPEEWEDAYAFALGASYDLNDDWVLRAGYAYDQSPIKNHVTARFPSTDRQWITAGFKYRIMPAMSVDFGAAYLFMDKVKLDEYNYDNNNKPVANAGYNNDKENLKAEYETKAFGLAAQLNWKF